MLKVKATVVTFMTKLQHQRGQLVFAVEQIQK